MINVLEQTKPAYHRYTYRETLAASERIFWRVEDIIGGDKRLDFDKPFLPESLARTGALSLLSPAERLALNQIRGNGYLCVFTSGPDNPTHAPRRALHDRLGACSSWR